MFIEVFGGRERLVRVMGGWNQLGYNRSLLEHRNNDLASMHWPCPATSAATFRSNLNNGQILQSWIDASGQAVAMDRLFQEILDGGASCAHHLPGGAYYDANRPAIRN